MSPQEGEADLFKRENYKPTHKNHGPSLVSQRRRSFLYLRFYEFVMKSAQIQVEKLLKDHEGDLLSKAQIDRLLGGRVNRSTLNRILDYLEESNKIIQHSTKGVMWVYAPKKE